MRRSGDDASVTPNIAPIPYADFLADIAALAVAIAADDGWSPTAIVGIGRGGLVPAVYLSHATGLPMLSCDWSSTLDDHAANAARGLAAYAQHGARLVFVDDINDSGRTIAALRAALIAAGAASSAIRFATLIDNVRSSERVGYRARTIDRAVTKDWFVFPWEAMASAGSIADDAAAVPDRTA